jgi:hypothetical protein
VIGGPVGEGEASPRAIPQVTVHDPLDVNGDGHTSPIDALQVINWLNTSSLTAENGIMEEGDRALDTNGDGRVSPIDALVVINRLNASSLASANQASSTQAIDAYFGDLMDDEEDAIFGLQLL